jgi:Co/Zn/Cd efflux system component
VIGDLIQSVGVLIAAFIIKYYVSIGIHFELPGLSTLIRASARKKLPP